MGDVSGGIEMIGCGCEEGPEGMNVEVFCASSALFLLLFLLISIIPSTSFSLSSITV